MIKPLKEKSWYKSCPPEETIFKIRNILHSVGIFLTEVSGSCNGFFHSHVYISNGDLRQFNIGTNGKGRTPAYALASAYSEMMERLQNGYKFYGTRYANQSFLKELAKDKENEEFVKILKEAHADLKYVSYADEKHMSLQQYVKSKDNIFSTEQTKYILENGDKAFLSEFDVCCVPYVNIFTGENCLLPADSYNSGSNGMCAGNTPAEALVQGFCELFERYALKKIFIDQVVPPQIPLSYFEGTDIYKRINHLENINVIVLDCSFGHSLPVIGAVVINPNNNTYCLEMAGAATASVALERCMTEHFQDGDPSDDMPNIFEPIKFDRSERYKQFYKQSRGFGKFDVRHILNDNPEFEFHGFNTIEGNSHEEELSYIVNRILKPNKFDCYVRDNSILGFPTYHIYIPEISDIYDNCNKDDLYITLKSLYLQPKVLNLCNLSPDVLEQICNNTIECYSKTRSSHIHLFSNFLYNSFCRQNRPNIHLFLATILLQCQKKKEASNELQKFSDELNLSTDYQAIKYYNCILELLKDEDISTSSTEKLSSIYGNLVVEEAVRDLHSKNQLQYYELPTCFHCKECAIAQYCFYKQAMSLVRKIQDATILYNQDDLKLYIRRILEKAENPEKSRQKL